jgi:hypothetical protein
MIHHHFFFPRNTVVIAVITLVSCLTCTFALSAQETNLRWKLSEGDRFRVESRQASIIDTRVVKRTSQLTTDITIVSEWNVVSSKGSTARIEQTIKSIQLEVINPADSTKSVAIDTDSAKRPPKLARKLASQLGSILGAVVRFSISERGEISDAEVAEKSLEQLNALPTDSLIRNVLDPQTLKASIRTSSLLLPEKAVEPGDDWTVETPTGEELTEFASLLTATYVGRKMVDNNQLDVIELSAGKNSQSDNDASDSNLGLRDFEWSGKYWFDSRAGHCARSERISSVTTTRLYREMEVETQVQVTSVLELTPTTK